MYYVMLDILGIEENVFMDLYYWMLLENWKNKKKICVYLVKFFLYYL